MHLQRSTLTRVDPAEGPCVVFLSGGTALRGTSRALAALTHNTVHLITPFDSGGSSSRLRAAFDLPAVGDLRNRLLSLSNDGTPRAQATIALLGFRLPTDRPAANLWRILDEMIAGLHPLVRSAPGPVASLARRNLRALRKKLPREFDLAGASVGNLVLAGGVDDSGDLQPALDALAEAAGARGVVMPITRGSFHLAARLADGQQVIGQHELTGKEKPVPPTAIEDIWLVRDLDGTPCLPAVAPHAVRDAIKTADLVVLPIGSFWTSVAANLLPRGVGEALVGAGCPRVFIPNPGPDPEQRSMSVAAALQQLDRLAKRELGAAQRQRPVVDLVVVDPQEGLYAAGIEERGVAALGVKLIRREIADSSGRIVPDRLAAVLLQLASG